MGFLANLKTSTRVAIAFAVLIAVLVTLMAGSVLRLRSLAAEIDDVAAARVPKIVMSARAVETLLQVSRQMRNVLVFDDENEIKSELADITKNQNEVAELLGRVEKLLSTDTERNFFREVQDTGALYAPLLAKFGEIAAKGDYSTAKDHMLADVRQAEARFVTALSGFIEYQASTSESAARDSHERARDTVAALGSVTALAAVLALLAALFIVRSLRGRLGEKSYAAQVANGIASGDLASEVHTRRGDDEVILRAMKRMRDDLALAVGSIRISANAVGGASEQLAAGSAQLASRTEEQASSLEETAASMEELAGTVKQTSDNARQADALAQNAAKRAVQGGEDVAQVVSTMEGISSSARRIADIISVIDGIAFQTNILALNAAVEAARAGEQGRGFAVVAAEVRTLAQRSAQAAKEIKELIAASATQVETGSRVVQKAGDTIHALVSDVKQVSDLMRAIAEAAAEQSRGVEQVNKTVSEMDKVVQENAGAVQESVTAAETMRQQAEALVEAVSTFRLAAGGLDSPAEVALAPAAARALRPQPIGGQRPARALAPAAAAGDDWEQF